MKLSRLTGILALAVVSSSAPAQEERAMRLTSTAFEHNTAIPSKHTCQGSDTSPPLAWSGLPEGTETLALIVDDPDAPDPKAPKMTWVHWVAYNLPPGPGGLEEGASAMGMPEGAGQGMNSWNRIGYGGPCPPVGEHRYFHKLYALDSRIEVDRPDKDALLSAMEGHVLDKAELIGTYEK